MTDNLLPDNPGVPIQVMRGGGRRIAQQKGGVSPQDIQILRKFHMGEGQELENVIDEPTKQAFLKQRKTCMKNSGTRSVLNKNCWAVSRVLRELLLRDIQSKNSKTEVIQVKVRPSESVAIHVVGSDEEPEELELVDSDDEEPEELELDEDPTVTIPSNNASVGTTSTGLDIPSPPTVPEATAAVTGVEGAAAETSEKPTISQPFDVKPGISQQPTISAPFDVVHHVAPGGEQNNYGNAMRSLYGNENGLLEEEPIKPNSNKSLTKRIKNAMKKTFTKKQKIVAPNKQNSNTIPAPSKRSIFNRFTRRRGKSPISSTPPETESVNQTFTTVNPMFNRTKKNNKRKNINNSTSKPIISRPFDVKPGINRTKIGSPTDTVQHVAPGGEQNNYGNAMKRLYGDENGSIEEEPPNIVQQSTEQNAPILNQSNNKLQEASNLVESQISKLTSNLEAITTEITKKPTLNTLNEKRERLRLLRRHDTIHKKILELNKTLEDIRNAQIKAEGQALQQNIKEYKKVIKNTQEILQQPRKDQLPSAIVPSPTAASTGKKLSSIGALHALQTLRKPTTQLVTTASVPIPEEALPPVPAPAPQIIPIEDLQTNTTRIKPSFGFKRNNTANNKNRSKFSPSTVKKQGTRRTRRATRKSNSLRH